MANWGTQRNGRGLGFAYLDYSGTQLAGVAVQPDNVIAQTESSIVYGLGLALMERIDIEDGRVKQSNFYDYHVPRMKDMPELEIKLIPTPNHPTGAGQMATPLLAPSISNGVYQLTGVRLRQQPMLPERVQAALAKKESGKA